MFKVYTLSMSNAKNSFYQDSMISSHGNMEKGLFLINQSAPYLNFCHFIKTAEAVSSTLTLAYFIVSQAR